MSASRLIRTAVSTAALSLVPQAAHAQPGYATWTWQISTDAGQSWRGGRVEVPSTRDAVRVRCFIDWSDPETNPYAFAGTQFDAVVRGLDGAGPADWVRNYERPYPLNLGGGNQTIVASRWGNQIKIDDSRDTSAPGLGTRGVFPGQLVEDFSGGRFTRVKPVSILEYELVLDGTAGTRLITDFPLTPSNAGYCTSYFVRTYTTPAGAQRAFFIDPCYPTGPRDEVRVYTAELVVVRCQADFNRDRQTDFFDYLDFIAAYAESDSTADFNGDQQVDMFDYLDFVAALDAGCA